MNKKQYTRLSFIGDAVLFALLTFALGWGWLIALVVAGAIMWLVRFSWISPVLLRYILKRLFLYLPPILLTIIAITFALIQLAPGDPFTQLILNPDITPEVQARYRAAFGLDKHWAEQFVLYIWNVLHLDFGLSISFKVPVFTLVGQRVVNTLILSVTTLILSWCLAIPAGIYAATHQYKLGDQVVSFFSFVGLAVPSFFLAFLMIYFISVTGNWLPFGGMHSANVAEMNGLERFVDLLKYMVIPVFVLVAGSMAGLTRIMRGNMLEVMGMQYITTARAKGLSERVVVYKHALRNAINPMVTILGFSVSGILGGAALTETVTGWPGLGVLMLTAITSQDVYLVAGSLLYSVLLLIIGNLLADILLAVVDPRVRIN